MPNPKHKHSKTRRDKRRTHWKAEAPTVAIDPTTGQPHLFHRAYWYENKLYYKGKVIMEQSAAL